MPETWAHIGRLWTNGEPFMAMDSHRRAEWRGYSEDHFERLLGQTSEQSTITVGAGRAALIGDGVVRDDSWIEVFRSADGTIAFVQAAGPDYPSLLNAALNFPANPDAEEREVVVETGMLAVFTSASDGAGEYADPLLPATPGSVPSRHGQPSREPGTGLLIDTGTPTTYRVDARWFTEIDDESCFARWLLIPEPRPNTIGSIS